MRFSFPQPMRSGQRVIRLEDIVKTYDKLEVYKSLNIEIEKAKRIVLVVPNGDGGIPAPSGVRGVPSPSMIGERCTIHGGGGVPAPCGVRGTPAPSSPGVTYVADATSVSGVWN